MVDTNLLQQIMGLPIGVDLIHGVLFKNVYTFSRSILKGHDDRYKDLPHWPYINPVG